MPEIQKHASSLAAIARLNRQVHVHRYTMIASSAAKYHCHRRNIHLKVVQEI
jgi:hypothetical protein